MSKRALGFMNKSIPVFNFVSTWNTSNTSSGSSTSTQVKLPLISGGTYNFLVAWGDGNSDTITVWNAAATTHTYSASGTYTVTISGVCTGWQFNNGGDRLKFISVASWGILKLGSTSINHFFACANLNLTTVSDILDLTDVVNLSNTFLNCTNLTGINRVNEWDVSAVIGMVGTFANTKFNSPIGNWNVGQVTGMVSFMQSNAFFNQNIGAWRPTLCNNFSYSFFGTTAFNNGGSDTIKDWQFKTTGTIDMSGMWQNSGLNQPLGGWNVQKVNQFGSFMPHKTPSTYSSANLDAIYNGWSALSGLTASQSISFGTAKYTAAAIAGRAILTGAPNNWSITDGGI